MADTFTVLIEKALSSDSDAERLACLKQAKKIYKSQGTSVMPRRIVQRETVEITKAGEPTITMARHQEVVDEIESIKNKLMKDNDRLGGENTALRTAQLKAGETADSEMIDLANKKVRKARAVTVIVAAIFVAAFMVML